MGTGPEKTGVCARTEGAGTAIAKIHEPERRAKPHTADPVREARGGVAAVPEHPDQTGVSFLAPHVPNWRSAT